MKKIIFTLTLVLVGFSNSFAQVGIGTTTPNASSILDITAIDKGFLPPRMTTAERNAIASPAVGLTIYNSTLNCLQWWNGTGWFNACTGETQIPGFVLTCGSATFSPAVFTKSVAYTGTATVPYTGGNGTAYGAGTPVASTGVTGLTATLQAGTLASGAGNLTYTVTGTPSAGGVASFAISFGGQSCTMAITSCGALVNGTFQEFLCHNLGANTALDPFSYVLGNADGSGGTLGYLYQWGRRTDGHELRNSATVSTQATNNAATLPAAVAGKFILDFLNWRSTNVTTLWGDGTTAVNPAKATNDPCPTGYKVPSILQWAGIFKGVIAGGAPNTATQNTWTWTGNGFKVGQALYLPAGGDRYYEGGGISPIGFGGSYWTSSQQAGNAYSVAIGSTFVAVGNNAQRSDGYAVRCIAE